MYLYTHVHRRVIHNSHKVEQSQVFINGLKNEHNVVYTYNGIYSALNGKGILTHATIWMNFEDIMLSKISQSHAHTKVLYDSFYMS